MSGQTKPKQKSFKQKCYEIVGGIGGKILDSKSELWLEAPNGEMVSPTYHDRVYEISKETGGKTGAWREMYQDLRYYLKNGYYTCDSRQPGSYEKCDYCDAEEVSK